MMRKILYIITFAILAFFAGCAHVDEFPSVYPPRDVTRVLFVYMAVDDGTISSAGLTNIEEMVAGATYDNMNGGQIIVFCDSYGSNSRLIRIFAGIDGLGHQETLIDYGENLDSSTPAILKRAFEDMKKYVTGTSYALAFGSHGTGWIPSIMHSDYFTALRQRMMMTSQYSGIERIIPQLDTRALFADTRPSTSWMELSDFAATIASLQTEKFDYILFDLCYMGGVEVAYALRNVTDNLVVSPAEVLIRGMPYDKVMPHLFATVPRLGDNGVCRENVVFFRDKIASDYATMSLIDCSKLENFAAVMEKIIEPKMLFINDGFDTAEIPYYDRNITHTIFDIKEFVKSLEPDAALLAEFEAALNELVLSKQSTYKMFDLVFDPDRYSGLTTYIPVAGQDKLLNHYRNTDWFKRVYVMIPDPNPDPQP